MRVYTEAEKAFIEEAETLPPVCVEGFKGFMRELKLKTRSLPGPLSRDQKVPALFIKHGDRRGRVEQMSFQSLFAKTFRSVAGAMRKSKPQFFQIGATVRSADRGRVKKEETRYLTLEQWAQYWREAGAQKPAYSVAASSACDDELALRRSGSRVAAGKRRPNLVTQHSKSVLFLEDGTPDSNGSRFKVATPLPTKHVKVGLGPARARGQRSGRRPKRRNSLEGQGGCLCWS